MINKNSLTLIEKSETRIEKLEREKLNSEKYKRFVDERNKKMKGPGSYNGTNVLIVNSTNAPVRSIGLFNELIPTKEGYMRYET